MRYFTWKLELIPNILWVIVDYFEYTEFNGDVHFFCFKPETAFLGKFGSKNQNGQFELKFGAYTNSNMQNSMVVYTLSVLDLKKPFWANLVQPFWANSVQKTKMISFSWNFVPRLIRVCRVQWWCSLSCFKPETIFLCQFGSTNQNCQFKLKSGT